jgi:cystathionine beta-lyase/cystathionine gamma-synthase
MRKPTPLGPSLEETSAFVFSSLEEETAAFESGDYTYSRIAHPIVTDVESEMAKLEQAPAALAFSSGMAALASLLISLGYGRRVLAQQDLYGGTRRLLGMLAEKGAVTLRVWRDIHPPEGSSFASDLILVEIPTNPLLRVPGLQEWRDAAARSRALLVVDATMATPIAVRPLSYGADLVVHSATKYLAGQDAVTGGFVCGSAEATGAIKEWRSYLGTIMVPRQATAVLSGLSTLEERFRNASATARALADALCNHLQVARVWYPLVESHPDCATARRTLHAGGGVLSFEIKGGSSRVSAVLNRLTVARIAATFGGIHPVITHPWTTSHRWVSADERAQMGISEGLVRLSVGSASFDALRDDLFAALAE